MSDSEADKLEKYLAEKARQDQEKEQEQDAESLSEYEACVLRESARVKELMGEAQREAREPDLDL